MPTSRLIDINTAAITYRRECLVGLSKKKYRMCIGCIGAMNALLPAELDEKNEQYKYRIVFDDEEYQKLMDGNTTIVCKHCEHQTNYKDVEFQNVVLCQDEQIITGDNEADVWVCPKCDKENIRSESEIIESTMLQPFYTRCVPQPPEPDSGLISYLNYDETMTKWVWLCLDNLEEAFTRFRDDNWNKSDVLIDESQIDTTLEELQKI